MMLTGVEINFFKKFTSWLSMASGRLDRCPQTFPKWIAGFDLSIFWRITNTCDKPPHRSINQDGVNEGGAAANELRLMYLIVLPHPMYDIRLLRTLGYSSVYWNGDFAPV